MLDNLGVIVIQTNLWSHIGEPKTPEEWRSTLLLPESYHIHQIEIDERRESYMIAVTHKDITNHEPIPYIVPIYRSEENKPVLDSIKMEYWQEGDWREKQLSIE